MGRRDARSSMTDRQAAAKGIAASIAEAILALPRTTKRLVMVTADAVAIPTALWAALALKFDTLDPVIDRTFAYFLVALGSALFFFAVFGLYRAVIRFMGPKATVTVTAGVTFSVLVLAIFDRFIASHQIPLSAFGIYWALALPYVGGSRFIARYLFLRAGGTRRSAVRVAIYGAGNAGARICSILQGGPEFLPVAFIDDRKSLQGSNVSGIRVYGAENLGEMVRHKRIDRILLAIPSAPRRRRLEILTTLEPLGVHVQSLPNLSDLISGKAQISELRDVDVGDLLGRDPVPPKAKLSGSCITGKCVLVTGAGGSIGSELCRQIIRLSPLRLVLFEMSELALYTIQRELEEIASRERLAVEVVSLLGNAHHRHRVREVLSTFGVHTVYHAAAYKHVPIVEYNVVEGIHNNVISTWYTAEAALETGVETFVLVSTDKAVNPANVMGATKRLAELVLQALQERTTQTRFCMVRFGNVLASSGSVVPLFQEQIRRGGPVTVTHPEVIRYFMTIPEAAQLVLQAGSMAKGGDVFVLDMGRPVRIDDLARRLVNLMGLTVRDAGNPDGDIAIEYTGLRTAEKLFEELLIGSNVTGTEHPMIMRAMEHHLPWAKMQEILNDLLVALASFDCHRALALLGESVAEYRADLDIRDSVWTRKAVLPHATATKVADFAAKRRQSEAGKPAPGQSPLA
jgi:UDP-N-acetylglucosamine 4,6-dehydratase